MLPLAFFDRDAQIVAQALLGKVLQHCYQGLWLSALIIETEAYYQAEKGSHASLGWTPKRQALFMPPGTIYMYYARGGDSFNISCRGAGNAVLLKSGYVYAPASRSRRMIQLMQQLNPLKNPTRPRPVERLCSGQTLLCRSLALQVPAWDQQTFCAQRLKITDVGYRPEKIIQTTRLGIPPSRDAQLPYRFIDYDKARFCTKNPLTLRKPLAYQILPNAVEQDRAETP